MSIKEIEDGNLLISELFPKEHQRNVLNTRSDLHNTLEFILDAAIFFPGIDCGTIDLFNSLSGRLELICYKGISQLLAEQIGSYPIDSRGSRLSAEDDCIFCFSPEEQDNQDPYHWEGLQTIIRIPITFEGRIWAVFNAGSHQSRQIASQSLKKLAATSRQIHQVIECYVTDQRINYRLRVENAVAQAGRKFRSMQGPDIDSALRMLGEAVDADRAYIFEFREDLKRMDNTYEWCRLGVESQIHLLQNMETSNFSWWMAKLRSGQNLMIYDVEKLPEHANIEKEVLQQQNIQSLLVIPVYAFDSDLLGYVGFDYTRNKRHWMHEDIEALAIFSQFLGFYWQHKKERKMLRQQKDQLARAYNDLQGMNTELINHRDQMEVVNRALEESKNDLIELNSKLCKERDRLEMAIKAANLALWDWDIPSGAFYFNERFPEMLGYREGELDSHLDEWKKRLIPEDETETNRILTSFINGDVSYYEMTYQLVRKDESVIWVKENGKAIKTDNDGKTVRAVGILKDISEQVNSQDKLMQSYARMERVLNQTVQALAETIERRDPYTAGHQFRVAELACCIAKEMGYRDNQVQGLYIASILHDIGKMYVPAEILSKPGRLNNLEFGLIKAHSQIGFDILKKIEFPFPVAQIVLQHHERLDGSGYPGGLIDQQISGAAKILAVADVVEAMASHRPYRHALGLDKALQEINDHTGELYDQQVVEMCTKILLNGTFHFSNPESVER